MLTWNSPSHHTHIIYPVTRLNVPCNRRRKTLQAEHQIGEAGVMEYDDMEHMYDQTI